MKNVIFMILAFIAICFFIMVITGKLRTIGKEPTYMRNALRARISEEEIRAMRQKSQAGLAEFTSRMRHPQVGDSSFRIALTREIDDGAVIGYETFWVKNLKFRHGKYSGSIVDDPFSKGLRKGDIIEFQASDISDWRYVHNGMLVGGEWLRENLGRMTPRQRSRYLKLLDFKIEEFGNMESTQDIAENAWRSLQWDYVISFPNNWKDPDFDNRNINTKSSLDVYCESDYGASTAVFKNRSSQYSDDIGTMELALKRAVEQNAKGRIEFLGDSWKLPGPNASRAYYYDEGNWRYHYSLIMADQIAVTISFHVPIDLFRDSLADIDKIRNSIRF